jgi:Zn-dependent alcohol dehydrogenase
MPGSLRPIGDCSRILGAIHELGGWRSGRSPPGGRLVVGLPTHNEMRLRSLETVLNGIQIIGSIAGTQVDMAEVFQLHARGRTHVTYQRRPLESVNQSFADILAGRIPARIGSTLGRRRPPSDPDPDVGAL